MSEQFLVLPHGCVPEDTRFISYHPFRDRSRNELSYWTCLLVYFVVMVKDIYFQIHPSHDVKAISEDMFGLQDIADIRQLEGRVWERT